jgi:hypothetical protein
MTLLETDKLSDNRAQPALNANDALSMGAVKAHATDGIAYRSEEAITAPRVVTRDDQLIVHDGTNFKALFGRDGIGNYVVKIAKDGYNVLTATDDELIFNSANNLFKIVSTGTVDMGTSTVGSAATVVDIAHGLPSPPTIIAFGTVTDATFGTRIVPLPHYTLGTTSGISSATRIITASLTMSTNSTNIRFVLQGNAIDTSATVRYYIIRETAN